MIQIADEDHFTEKWTWRENGKDQAHTIHFKLQMRCDHLEFAILICDWAFQSPITKRQSQIVAWSQHHPILVQDSHFRQAPKLLVVIQAVAHHENIGNGRADVVGLNGNHAPGGLIEERDELHAVRLMGSKNPLQVLISSPCVEDILNNQNVAARDARIDLGSLRRLYLAWAPSKRPSRTSEHFMRLAQ